MKQSIHSSALFFFIFLLTTSQSLARFLASKQGEGELKLSETTARGSLAEMQAQYLFNELMGSEDCHNGDEECLKKRMISEVHLDYIYTQHHKP